MDLHIHTCLSPCGDSRMIPPEIISRAREAQLDAVGITDHNSSRNVAAVRQAARGSGVTVLGGMELSSREEIHLLALFTGPGLKRMQQVIDAHLEGENNKDFFGPQYVVDAEGYVVTEETRWLSGATTLSFDKLVDYIHQFGGIAIASHIDKPSFSLLSQLGFIPPGCPLDGVEIARPGIPEAAEYRNLGYPAVSFSDAHFPEDIGSASSGFILEAVTAAELQLALTGREGRRLTS